MNFFLALIGVTILIVGSNAFAAPITCRDTKTFAYGRMTVSEKQGDISIEFYSSVLSTFVDKLGLLGDLSYPTIELEFAKADCTPLSVPFSCSGRGVRIVAVNLIDQGPAVNLGTLDFARVNLQNSGLAVAATLGNASAQTNVPLTNCEP